MRVRVQLGTEPSTGILAMASYSALAHILALVLIVFAPRMIPRQPPPPLLLTAQIVSLPSSGPPAPPAAAAQPTPTERAEKAARAARKEPEPAPPEPDKPKPPPRKKPPRERQEPPPGPIEPAQDESRGSAEPQPTEPLTQGIGLGAGGDDAGTGIPSITSASFPYRYYRTTMVNLIRARWQRPLTPGLTESLRCAVSFVITRNGRVSDVAVSVPSGLDALDASAMRAVLQAGPLPPLPYQYVSPSVRAELIFELTPD